MNVFLERYRQLGQDIDPEATKSSIPKAIRVNTLKITDAELMKRMKQERVSLKKIPFLDFGYSLENAEFSLASTTEYLMGYYYIQETAAQIPAQVLRPRPGDVVLDMSAAPGGKTTQLAQYMENKGVIVALDTNSMRLITLRNNLERLGVKNAILYQKDAQFSEDLGIMFDKILLDAPCSGNFCIDDAWFEKRTVENLRNVAKIQKQLLNAAASVLKNGGELVYSTCSLEPEEDEMVVDWFLKEHPEMKMEKIDVPFGDEGITAPFGTKLSPDVRLCRRFWPNRTKTQGFFMARFRKTA